MEGKNFGFNIGERSSLVTNKERRTYQDIRERFPQMTHEERAEVLDDLHKKAYTSRRTGLPNFLAYEESAPSEFQVLLDLDNFKKVNDSFGQEKGDDAIRLVGEIVGKEKNSYHLSGDEFVIKTNSEKEGQQIGKRIQMRMFGKAIAGKSLNGAPASVPLRISFGVGKTMFDANVALKAQKAERAKAGLRVEREVETVPPRTLDTMSEAIALSSPSGRISKRAKSAATAKLSKALFGEGGLQRATVPQPSESERLLAEAKQLRELAERGMSQRKYVREAERLESQAAALLAERAPGISTTVPETGTPQEAISPEERARRKKERAEQERQKIEEQKRREQAERDEMNRVTDEQTEELRKMGVFSRASGAPKSTTVESVKTALAPAIKQLAVPVEIYATSEEAKKSTGVDVRKGDIGFYDGKIHLIAESVSSPAEAEEGFWHEVLHAGTDRVFKTRQPGTDYDRVLTRFAALNPNVKAEAAKWQTRFGSEFSEQVKERGIEDVDNYVRLRGIEEGIAKVAETKGKIRALNYLIAGLQRLFRSIGLNRLADSMEGWTNAEVSEFIRQAQKAAMRETETDQRALPAFSRAAWIDAMPQDTQEALRKAGVWHVPPTLKARVQAWKGTWAKRMRQGLVDQFDPIKEYDYHAYMLARLTRGADNALDGLLHYGTVYLDNSGAIDVNFEEGGFLGIMSKLTGEHDRFLAWVIGNRAERLMGEGREHNFTQDDIRRLKALNQGQMKDGSSRAQLYDRTRADLDRYNKAVLDIAERAGLIDASSRSAWEKDFYVPFYRLMEDDLVKGPMPSKGLVNQYAFKVLKGGEQAIGDPMENVLKNWAHLLDASLKNQAAKESLLAAQRMGVVVEGTEETVRQMAKAAGMKDAVVSFTDQGAQRWFMVEDPYLLDAIKAVGFTGFQGVGMKIMQKFKKWLTLGVTVSPTFRIRNVIRDSLQMIGTNPASYNALDNVLTGWKATKEGSQEFAHILAGGGVMRFGTLLEGDRAAHVKRLVEAGIDDKTILTTPQKIKDMLQAGWDWWQHVGDRAENVNRAALYKTLRAQGKTHLEASFAARDTMDFSMQGTWAAVRFLSQTVPFFNARLQGLYKLGRGAAEDPRRFGFVVGGAALASIALMLAYKDDDDWKRREDWDRETFWWFKIGDKAFRIPKPFEIGAIATIAERGLEAMISNDLTGKQFAERVYSIISQQLSMNPVPQLAMPLVELYANRDSFTDRPIETMGMEKLSKQMRFGPNTSATARVIGKAGVLSPVQIDHLVNGYFGWLGAHVVATADLALRPAMDMPGKPAWKVDDVLVVGDFVKDLPAYQSKYVTRMYEQMREVQRAMADLRELQKTGATEEATKLLKDKGDKIKLYRLYTHSEKQMENLNRQIKLARMRSEDPEEKRARLDSLYAARNRIAELTETRARALQQ